MAMNRIKQNVIPEVYAKISDILCTIEELKVNCGTLNEAFESLNEILKLGRANLFYYDCFKVGGCANCVWNGKRPQKCACCRRNREMKDNFTPFDGCSDE